MKSYRDPREFPGRAPLYDVDIIWYALDVCGISQGSIEWNEVRRAICEHFGICHPIDHTPSTIRPEAPGPMVLDSGHADGGGSGGASEIEPAPIASVGCQLVARAAPCASATDEAHELRKESERLQRNVDVQKRRLKRSHQAAQRWRKRFYQAKSTA